jgi:hypothetical protein
MIYIRDFPLINIGFQGCQAHRKAEIRGQANGSSQILRHSAVHAAESDSTYKAK